MIKRILLTLLTSVLFTSLAGAANLVVGTYNIRNFNTNNGGKGGTDLNALKRVIKNTKGDLLAIQEIKNIPLFKRYINSQFPEYSVVLSRCGGTGRQSLGFLYRKSRLKLVNFKEDLSFNLDRKCNKGTRPGAIAEFRDSELNERFLAIGVHLKAGAEEDDEKQRVEQYKVLVRKVNEFRRSGYSKFVVLGDFNTVDYEQKKASFHNFRRLKSLLKMRDAVEKLGCSAFWTGEDGDGGIEESSFLDHVLISQEFARMFSGQRPKSFGHCSRVRCGKVPANVLGHIYRNVSDHCPVMSMFVQ